jgi:adenylate cyclase
MAEERAQRRLAAILAADVVGYSRLMQADEAGTLTALKARRTGILQPLISRHHGRIVKVMGDGVLVEFASAVNAVTCAVELQEAMDAANAGLPEDRQIVLRVGINLGDVMVEGGDLYGDGVNVAARLEAIAEPGCIFVSETVFSHVKGKIDLNFEDLGERSMKNMAEPVRVYRTSGIATRITGTTTAKGNLASKPSIAILPFVNMSADPDQEYLSDGITQDVITELSRYRELFGIARNSSFQYRDRSMDMKRVGRELGVEYLVEGSLRKAGDRIRVTAQLIEAATGSHLWAERYERELKDIFAIQDEVAQTIASTLVGRIERSRIDTARRRPTESWPAYDCVLQAHYAIDHYDTESAEVLLTRAIGIDPGYARVYEMLSKLYLFRYFDDPQDATLEKALTSAQKGLSLDDTDPYCHMRVGSALTWLGQFGMAELYYDRAIALNPNNATFIMSRAGVLARVGRAKEALEALDRGALRDPHLPPWYWEARSVALFVEKQYGEVIKSTGLKDPKQYWDHAYLAAAYAYLGREQEAHAETAEVLRMRPDFSILAYAKQEPYKDPNDLKHLLDGFRKAGLPE